MKRAAPAKARLALLAACLLALGPGATAQEPAPPADAPHAVPYDHHVHLQSPELRALLTKIGLPLLRTEEEHTSLAAVLRVHRPGKVLLVSNSYLWTGFQLGERELAKVRAEHDFLAAQVRGHPQRARGFFALHPLRPWAAEELARCSGELGLHGLKLHFDNSKVDLRDAGHRAAVRELLRLAAAKHLPVLVHLDNRAESFGGEDARLFLDEVLAQVPPLELYVAHLGTGGGFDASTEAVLDAFEEARARTPEIAAHRVLFELSGVVVPDGHPRVPRVPKEALERLAARMRRMGLERFVFGTDYPLWEPAGYARQVQQGLGLSDAELATLLSNTGPLLRDG